MGNNQGQASGTSLQAGGVPRGRRPSMSENDPLEVPIATKKLNVDVTPPNSDAHFGQRLLQSLPAEPPDSAMSSGETYYKRYRAGSISMEPSPALLNKKIPAVIKWDKGGKEVFIAGTFNNWEKKIPLVKSSSNFYTIVELPEGEHQYKFFVDGQWVHNPDEPVAPSGIGSGTVNNVLVVKNTDFEIVEALENDSEAVMRKDKESADYPEQDYSQEIPIRRPADRHTGPPILPPHLLQVILNKDIPEHLEPGLLPEPNHVMLNHLYALSIKDGVMVLSDTSRYKKKYVTTLLYKPIDS